MDHGRPLLEAIADTGILEALGEGLLDCADGEAWLAMPGAVRSTSPP